MFTYKVITEYRQDVETAINQFAAEGWRVHSFHVDAPPMMSASNKGPTVTVVMEKQT